ncbi:MAG: hypothetical protein HQK73_03620 [Desulfamplus sp.]|nr:hypothetical protein [Desulfamplus sp.]
MKKKPSLLDIEIFVQKRKDEKEQELSHIESGADAIVIENGSSNTVPTKSDIVSPQSKDNDVATQPQNQLVVGEMLTSVIEVTDTQRDDINKLKQDMFKLREQLRVYHSFLSNQQKKILELEKSISEKILPESDSNRGIIDANYSKLLLKNIVWLKEEKDFSSNDVARLFRAEGFQTPHPHENWDEKVINTLYNEAKKSFL